MRCEQCGVKMLVPLRERWRGLKMRLQGQKPVLLHQDCVVIYLNRLLEKDIDEPEV